MRRRHVTTAVTMMVLVGVLVLGVVLGWQQLFAKFPEENSADAPGPSCTTEQVGAGQRLASSQVRVSVFNAGDRNGLAGTTMTALHRRGFKVGAIGNAPTDAKVGRVAIWSTEHDDAEANLVARQFGKKVTVTFSDVDLGPGVDVIVGNKFSRLAKARHSIRIKSPEQVCVSNPSSPATDAAGDSSDESQKDNQAS